MQDKISKLTYGEGLSGYFSKRGWWTPNHLPDNLITAWFGVFGVDDGDSKPALHLFKVEALAEQENRKNAGMTKCPRCYGYHEQSGNVDSLCEICEVSTAPFRYDNNLQPA